MACDTLSSSFSGQALRWAHRSKKSKHERAATMIACRASYSYSWSSSSSSSSSSPLSSGLHDWRALCASINGQVATQPTHAKSHLDSPDLPYVNGVHQLSKEESLDLIPVSSLDPIVREVNLPRPLSMTDLAPVPLHGSTLRVAYQGVPGAYSEAAAGKAYPLCEPVPCDQFEAAFKAVELWLADRAVLPVENSLGGSIHRNYDLLLRHRLHIVGEVQLPVHHCLLAMPGVTTSDLRRVISHPQALAQCENSLSRLGLNVSREAVDDTAGAAQFIADNNIRDTAAVASSRAAEIYGMNILAEGIQDDCGNVTRFVMLAREPIIPKMDRPFKTSIVFANEGKTGSLFKVLSAFAFRDINLTKIESRPQRKKPLRIVDGSNSGKAKYFEYLYYIDFEASMADKRAQNALGELQEFTSFLRVLGSYPMDTTALVGSPPNL